MLNPFGIILIYKMLGWFDGQDIGVEPNTKVQFPLPTYTIYVEYVYLYICLVHVCKCIIHRWVVDR
jgi:hypothetical protein